MSLVYLFSAIHEQNIVETQCEDLDEQSAEFLGPTMMRLICSFLIFF